SFGPALELDLPVELCLVAQRGDASLGVCDPACGGLQFSLTHCASGPKDASPVFYRHLGFLFVALHKGSGLSVVWLRLRALLLVVAAICLPHGFAYRHY